MADIYNMTDTWDDSGTQYTAIKMDVTDTASAAGSKLMELLTGAVSRFQIDKTGNVTAQQVNAQGGLKMIGAVANVEMAEMSAPSGTSNRAKIFAQDNGSGKTQLMVIFGSGAAQQIAIEP